MNTAASDLSGKEDLAVQKKPRREEKKRKENNRWDRCQPGMDSVFTQYQRKKLLTPEYQRGEIYYSLFFG